MNTLVDQLQLNFPTCRVGYADLTDESTLQLYPEEEALLSPTAHQNRRTEFSLGRLAARRAIAALRDSDVSQIGPILRGEKRSPLWPRGIIGSITHTDSKALAMVSTQSDHLSIGIDLERVPETTPRSVKKFALSAEELTWSAHSPQHAIALFSAKEAFYKAVFPFVREHLPFDTIVVTPQSENLDQGTPIHLTAILQRALSPHLRKGDTVRLAALSSAPFIVCATVLEGVR